MQILTNSSMGCYVICPRRYEYKYERGLRKTEISEVLRIGSMIHDGLDHLARGSSLQEVFGLILKNYETLLQRTKDDDHATNILVEAEKCFRLIQGYSEHWADDQIEMIDSEVSFRVPIQNPMSTHWRAESRIFERAGIVDKIVRLKRQIFIMEHKTTSRDINPNSEYWRHLRIDPQISGYLLGAMAKYPAVDGIFYDVIRKPAIRPKKLTKAALKKWLEKNSYYGEPFEFDPELIFETPRMWGARLISEIRDEPERYYQRQEIARLTSDLIEYKQDVWSLQKQIRDSQKYGRWYRNFTVCLQPYRCEFANLCLGGLTPERAAEDVPVGFEIVEDVHPELNRKEKKDGKSNGTADNPDSDGSAETASRPTTGGCPER